MLLSRAARCNAHKQRRHPSLLSGQAPLHSDHPSEEFTLSRANALRACLGSTSAILRFTQDRLSGATVGTQNYYAFGKVRTTTGTRASDYTFTGQKVDDSAGLMYYGARYYDAVLGRFTQPDTIVPNPGNPQSLNRYSYVLNNPIRYYDSDGHCLPFCLGLVGAMRVLPRETFAAGARFVADQHIPLVSDFAALDVANADNLWAAINGDQIGLSTAQRATAYGKFVAGSAIEGAIVYIGVKAISSSLTAGGTCAATDCKNEAEQLLSEIKPGSIPISHPDEVVKLSETAAKHMDNPARWVPQNLLDAVVKSPSTQWVSDPQGKPGFYRTIVDFFAHGKDYLLEIVYNPELNEIVHFMYGPANEIEPLE